MTTEQINKLFTDVAEAVRFHVHNVPLRDVMVAFLAEHRTELLAAPASSKHHHAYPGGLLHHIDQVMCYAFTQLQHMLDDVPIPCTTEVADQMREDLAIAVVLHDMHKIGDPWGRRFYEPNMIKASRKKDETDMVQSTAKPYARNDLVYKMAAYLPKDKITSAVGDLLDRNKGAFHEGELSLFYVNAVDPNLYSMLNDSVKFAIRHHDGAYSSGAMFEMQGNETPVQLALHNADMISSRQGRWVEPTTSE